MTTQTELEAAVDALIQASPDGFADASAFPTATLSGYVLPGGHSYKVDEMVQALIDARAVGLTQEHIESIIEERARARLH